MSITINKKPTMSTLYYNEREARLSLSIMYEILKNKGIVIKTVAMDSRDATNINIKQRILLLQDLLQDMRWYHKNIVYDGKFACEYVINNDMLTFVFKKAKKPVLPPLTDEQRKKAMEEIATWK